MNGASNLELNVRIVSCRINYYREGDVLYPKFDAVEAYKRSIRTWAKWIRANINPAKQLVFYRGYSSAHFRYFRLPLFQYSPKEETNLFSGEILFILLPFSGYIWK